MAIKAGDPGLPAWANGVDASISGLSAGKLDVATAVTTYAPIWRDETAYYVNPVTGSDAAVGAAVTPLRTVGEAVKRAEESAQKRATAVTVNLVAGTYAERVRFSDFTPHNLNVTVKGPGVGGHPNVPTAIFTEGADVSANAFFNRNRNLTLTLQDLKFVGYRGTTSSSGLTNYTGTVFTINCHATQCYYGLSSQTGNLDVKGGILNDCGRLSGGTGTGAGVRSLQLNRHAIGTQNAGVLTLGPVFTNCQTGVFAQESSTGHVDWSTFEDCVNGVIVRVNARANCDGSSFKRSTVDITADSNGHVFVSDNVTFGTGADASTNRVIVRTGSGGALTTSRLLNAVEVAYGRSDAAVDGVYTAQTVTGTLVETDLYSKVVKAPFWNNGLAGSIAPSRLKIRAIGTLTGTAGTKAITMRLGGSLVAATFTATEVGTFLADALVLFVGPARQVMSLDARRHLGTGTRLSLTAAALDMTVDQTLRLTTTLANTADSVTVETVELSWA